MKQPSTSETLKANPEMTYGQAVGYSTGVAAAGMGQKFAGLSADEWINATDDYAHGYRKGYNDYESRIRKQL